MKAPSTFSTRQVGKTLVTRTQGTKVSDVACIEYTPQEHLQHAAAVRQSGRHLIRGWLPCADRLRWLEGARVRGVPGRPAERECPQSQYICASCPQGCQQQARWLLVCFTLPQERLTRAVTCAERGGCLQEDPAPVRGRAGAQLPHQLLGAAPPSADIPRSPRKHHAALLMTHPCKHADPRVSLYQKEDRADP